MNLTLKAGWQLHSHYKGVPIFKRLARTGTSGGQWLTASTYCSSLRQAKKQIDDVERCGSLRLYVK